MKRTALYLRVSTLDQHPETQLHDLRQLAQQRGLEIIVTYTDYLSSTKIRWPKLEQMLADARQGKFQVLLVIFGAVVSSRKDQDHRVVALQLAETAACSRVVGQLIVRKTGTGNDI